MIILNPAHKAFVLLKCYVSSGIARSRFRKSRLSLDLAPDPSVQEVLGRPYIFVLSTGRCGTAFLTKVLECSPEMIVHHSTEPELLLASRELYCGDFVPDSAKLAILAARFETHFLDAAYREKIYTETNNRITPFAPALSELLPNSKFIHLVRDPRDFVMSGLRRGYYDTFNTQYQRLSGVGIEGWESMSQLEKVATEWEVINSSIMKFKSTISPCRILTVRSEDLFSCAEIVAETIDFIGLSSSSQVFGEKKLAKLMRKPINVQRKGKLTKFNDWDTHDQESCLRLTPTRTCLGYR